MPKTIVCGVDNSDAAAAVVDTGRWLADALGARILVLYVVEEPDSEAEEQLTSIRERVSLGDDDRIRLVEGSPTERLLAAVTQDGAELLIVGSRGRGSIRSGLFGSVSRTVATEATCPVVVVPPDASRRIEGNSGRASIVCGVDGSSHAVAAARLGGDLAARMGCRLLVVHALSELKGHVAYPGQRGTTPPASAQPDQQARLANEIVDVALQAAGPQATGLIESGLPWDVLESVADREDGRLLMIAARGLSAARAALFGSVATKLATSGRYPVVILPESAQTVSAASAVHADGDDIAE